MLYALADQESGVTEHPTDQFAAGELHQGMFQMSESMQKEWGVTDPYSADQESQATARAEASYLQRFKGNVAEAIAAVEPFGLDLCSGVRTNDQLDPVKLRAFFAAIAQKRWHHPLTVR